MLKETSIALAGVVGLALLVGPAVAQSGESVTLRVPVKLKKMVAEQARITCQIWPQGHGSQGYAKASSASEWFNIPNGDFDQVIEMIMTSSPGKHFAGTDQYVCRLELPGGLTTGTIPSQGTPSGPNDHKLAYLAKPDQFFRAQAKGRLDGMGVVNPDLGGAPKDFKSQKQP
jgi:hypothetical protein